MHQYANLRTKLTVAACFFLGTFAVLEIVGRILLAPPPPNSFPGLSPNEIAHDELLWHHQPGFDDGGEDGPINNLGFRGPEISQTKSPGQFRILSLGESSSYGTGVGWQETYAYVLEKKINTQEHDVQVINAGVRAWSTLQSARFLELKIDELQPDLVLVYHEVNDFLPTSHRGINLHGSGMNDVEVMALYKSRRWFRWIIQNSRFVAGIRLIIARARASTIARITAEFRKQDVLSQPINAYFNIHRAQNNKKPWLSNPNPIVRLPTPLREKALQSLINTAQSRGVQIIFLHPSYRISRPHRCVMTRIARAQKIPLLEMDDVIYSHAARTGRHKAEYFIFGDKVHPNQLGHAVMGKGIADFLLKNNFIHPQPPTGTRGPVATTLPG